MQPTSPPVVLTIAGSDCSAGAGIQADLKTFTSFGTFGLTAVTCAVSETPRTVRQIHPIPVNIVTDQVSLLLDSYPVKAVKTGMLFSPEHITAIANVLSSRNLPVIVDPVMVASSGDSLMRHEALAAFRESLLPLATLVTPNLPEASALLGRTLTTLADLEPAALELARIYHNSWLIKGGHLAVGTESIDIFADPLGDLHRFSAPWITSPGTHGTGCTLSAAIAAGVALDLPLLAAIASAKRFISLAIGSGHSWTAHDGTSIHALKQSIPNF
jgi:hydroxymethylpyrimidine/phosphomethylpyrimidine kinase